MSNSSWNRFDRAAAEWDAHPARVDLARQVAAAIGEAIPLSPVSEVLDFGAGTGLLTLALASRVARVVAVDSSIEMTRVLRSKIEATGLTQVEVWHADIGTLSLPERRFDVVVSSMVLHHLPDVPSVLARLRAVLKPGGWIALADLAREDGSFHDDPEGVHHLGFEDGQLRVWMGEAGFVNPAVREIHRMSRADKEGRIRDYPILLVSARVS